MSDVVIDTNIAIWYFSDPSLLTRPAENAIDEAASLGTIHVPSISIVELIYITEKGKVAKEVLDLLRDALDDPATAFALVDLSRGIADSLTSIPRSEVPDMPDRIIAATGLHLNLPIISSDSRIRQLRQIQIIW